MGKDRHSSDKKERKHKHKHKHKKAESRKSGEREHGSHKRHTRHEERAALPCGAARISEDDYFLRATEFRVWLAQAKGKYVDDLATEEATALFRDGFARKWNRGKLARMFYEGVPDAVLEQTKRTRHRWGFVARLGERERFTLASTKDSVGVATRKENLLVSSSSTSGQARALGPSKQPEDEKRGGDGDGKRKRKRKAVEDEDEDEREAARRRRKSERRREERDVALDELAPKATGREAMLEKRRETGQRLHGAARDREDGRDGLDQSDDFLMGEGGLGRGRGGEDEYRRRMAQRDSMRRRKDEERQEKLAGLAAKESARMDKFLEDMGLSGATAKGGKPMTIAPRR